MDLPLISVVIPTCDRLSDLSVCLQSVTSQTPGDGTVEVFVCDDGRSGETREMLAKEFPMVNWIPGPRKGPAANRNCGVQKARGKWIVFFDDDVIPAPVCLASYLAAIRNPSSASSVIYGSTYRVQPPPSLLWEAPHNPDGRVLISCNMALTRSLFLQLGGFDERFPSAAFEDTEFAARIHKLSISIKFAPEARVNHPLRMLPSCAQLAKRWEARVIYAYDLGGKPGQVCWRLPLHVAKVIASRFRGQRLHFDNFRASTYFAGEFLLVLLNLPKWLRKHWNGRRSAFWTECILEDGLPSKFGF